MAGHSKWANIKRQKARVDAVKGKVFAKVSRAMIVAARAGADPAGNFQLRTAIDKAKQAGIPNENIERAIAKGSGQLGSDSQFEEMRYEGYGAGGIAVIVEALTDNRNRTAAELRTAFTKGGGNLGETGCVSWMFQQKGVITITGAVDEEQILEASLLAEADSYEMIEGDPEEGTQGGAEVFTDLANLEKVSQTLRSQGLLVTDVELRWLPNNFVEVDDTEQARSLLKLMNALEDLDDVQNVTTNFEFSENVISSLGI